MEVLGDLSADSLCGFVEDNVAIGSTVKTDAWQGYKRLARLGYDHQPNTPVGRAVAVLFLKAHGRVLSPGLAILDPGLPAEIAARTPLAVAWRTLNRSLDDFIDTQLIAA